MILSIAAKVPVTEAEGPGKRFAVWVQGCPFRCPGCCNPQYLSFKGDDAEGISPSELANEILQFKDEIEGVTFIGGEPFSQAQGLAEVAAIVRTANLSVMVFSGHTLSELENVKHAPEFLRHIDLLVDGRFEQEKLITNRRWVGSSNQQTHFLTERYRDLETSWPSESNSIEIRYRDGKLTINGFPHDEITSKCLAQLKQ